MSDVPRADVFSARYRDMMLLPDKHHFNASDTETDGHSEDWYGYDARWYHQEGMCKYTNRSFGIGEVSWIRQ